MLSIVSCGGGSGDSGSTDNTDSSVQLSGVLGLGEFPEDSPGNDSAQRFSSSPESQIVVVAVDTSGNSFATTTDEAGFFEFPADVGIRTNTAYALVFIDMATLEIIATLTNGSGQAGSLTLQGDTEIAEIVIDPNIRLASIFGQTQVDGEPVSLEIAAATTLDIDGDGQISQGEMITTLVNTTQVGEIDTITSIAAFTFLGQRHTWTIGADLEDDAFDDSICEWINEDTPPAGGNPVECADEDDDNDPTVEFLTDSAEMTLLITEKVEGPDGRLVDVAKLLEFTFLNRPYVDPDDDNAEFVDESLIWETGFAQGIQADINSTAASFGEGPGAADEYWTPYIDSTLGEPPTTGYRQSMGLLGWSEYNFADIEEGQLRLGSKSKDDDDGTFEIEWSGSTLPLNLPINVEFELTETETDEEDGVIVVETTTSLVTVILATNGDGTPALLQEANSEQILPVFQIRYTDIDDEDESECSYILARYGVEGDDADENCDDSSDWLESFENVRFGRVDDSGSTLQVIDQTPESIIANDTGDVLPVDGSGQLTDATSNWITYLFNNSSSFDYQYELPGVDDGDDFGNTTEFWAWVKRPEVGSSLAPQPEPNADDDTETILMMGQTVGTITVSDVTYQSSESGVQFYLDLRTEDAEGEDSSVLDGPVAIDASIDTSSATNGDSEIDINATFGALPDSDSELWVNVWNSLEDPDNTGDKTYITTKVTVWVIMDADGDLETDDDQYEFPVDSYKVVNPTPVP